MLRTPFDAPRVAVLGAGLAGATCARALADAGALVEVFDKSRGVGGRMATRRAEWPAGPVCPTGAPQRPDAMERAAFDHGVVAFTARSAAFRQAVELASRQGLLAPWTPRLAPGTAAPDEPWWVVQPDMPAWCRTLLRDLPLQTGRAIDALRPETFGWVLESGGETVAEGFDVVVVAMPPVQARALLAPHGRAGGLDVPPLQPCWTLMAVGDDCPDAVGWDLARPSDGRDGADGPIATIVRNDSKPGRSRVPGRAHWLVHATAAWSLQHLEDPPERVRAALLAALDRALDRARDPSQDPARDRPHHAAPAAGTPAAPGWTSPRAWHHAVVHRWRYAQASGMPAAATRCAWDPASGLGVCGDALGGGGVEGAWRSGQALARLIQPPRPGSQARGPGTSPTLASLTRFS